MRRADPSRPASHREGCHGFPPAADPAHTLCGRPVTVVDLAGDIDLPLGVVRVLLSDLSSRGMIEVTDMTANGPVTDQRLLRNILDGLRAL